MYYIGCDHGLEKELRREPVHKIFFPFGEFEGVDEVQDGVAYQYVVSKKFNAVFLIDVEVTGKVELNFRSLLRIFEIARDDMRRYKKTIYVNTDRDTAEAHVGEALLELLGFQETKETLPFTKLLGAHGENHIYQLKQEVNEALTVTEREAHRLVEEFRQNTVGMISSDPYFPG